MHASDRPARGRIDAALAAAAALRKAARLTDPASRADAVWDGLRGLRSSPIGAGAVVGRLEDDGMGDAGVPDARVLFASARDLEKLAATARGVRGASHRDPGRVRSPALRADGPTTRERTRQRHRRRLRNRGRRVP
jgi:hypothetical protein